MIDKERLNNHLDNGEREYILCSANYYNDGIDHTHKPFNIDKGFILSGWRHHNCNSIFVQMYGFPYKDYALKIKKTEVQGFITNKNRFLDRKEALKLVKENGQLKKSLIGSELTSEDLW